MTNEMIVSYQIECYEKISFFVDDLIYFSNNLLFSCNNNATLPDQIPDDNIDTGGIPKGK